MFSCISGKSAMYINVNMALGEQLIAIYNWQMCKILI